ncbi:MAG: glycosyltransferase family 4 protein [Atribacterota bacterium]
MKINSNKDNIMFMVPDLNSTGGISRYNKNIINTLKDDYKLTIISRNDKKNKYKNLKITNFGRIRNTFFKKIFFSLYSVYLVFRYKPKMILCGHVNFSPICYYISFIKKINYLVLTHGIDVWKIKNKSKIKALKKADLIITVSRFTKEKIEKQVPNVSNKLKILPNMIDGNIFYPENKSKYLRKKHNIASNDKVLLYVGRLDEKEKGIYTTINAFKKVLKKIPNIKLIIVGHGKYLRYMRKYVKDKNIKNKVILTGFVNSIDRLREYYNLCDIFIMPSKKEGFGIVFLEALACGKPVIGGIKDGSVDALQNGEVGILVDPDNEEEISNSILNVFNKDVPDRLLDSTYLREKTLENYGISNFRNVIKKLIGEIL